MTQTDMTVAEIEKFKLQTHIRRSLLTICNSNFVLFFQAEQLGASPVEKCTNCKSTIKNCRICNSKTSVLSATEIEEHNISKEPGAYSTKTCMAMSLAQFYNSLDTSRVSNLYPEAYQGPINY